MTDQIDRATVYKGEALLLRWGENSKGRSVTLQLEPHQIEHPFKGLKCGENGQRLMVVAVLMADDEQPQAKAEAPARSIHEPVPIHKAKPFTNMPRSSQLYLRCGHHDFAQWLGIDTTTSGWSDQAEKEAKRRLGITSKKQLDFEGSSHARKWDEMLTSFETETRYGVK